MPAPAALVVMAVMVEELLVSARAKPQVLLLAAFSAISGCPHKCTRIAAVSTYLYSTLVSADSLISAVEHC